MSSQIPDPDEQWALRKFPGLAGKFRRTSDPTEDYNCLAWALGLTNAWIDPIDHQIWPGKYWPPGIPEDWSVTTTREILARSGYAEETTNEYLELEWEKVALFAKNSGDLHFARQLPSGKWTSKLGMQIDIEHDDLGSLTGTEYGRVILILKRKRSQFVA
jgi:hypothetical protein